MTINVPAHADRFAAIRKVADATLYEGYVLYPYRASATKNRNRWQFGVLMPPAYVALASSETDRCTTELLLEARPDGSGTTPRVIVEVRFLHVRLRSDASGREWSEADERAVTVEAALGELVTPLEREFTFAGLQTDDGSARHDTREVNGAVRVHAVALTGPHGAFRLRVDVENRTPSHPTGRGDALRSALVAAHTMLAVEGGRFLSMVDPPEWALPHAEECHNVGTWPVLGDTDDVVLSSPIILEDRPRIAPESAGDWYDATEIDELLTLRTMTLTEEEKAAARATDPRAAALIDHVDHLGPQQFDRLHGALRDVPWWDPAADAAVSPETDAIVINGVRVARGSRVTLRPGIRSTDAQDLFLAGRIATVEAVFVDVDGNQHLAVTPEDAPDLAELARLQGRFSYFAPDEVEPLVDAARDEVAGP